MSARPTCLLLPLLVALCCGSSAVHAQSAGERIQSVFDRSQTAKTIADYDQLLAECDEIGKLPLKPAQIDYMKKLLAWCHDRRGELHAQRAVELAHDGQPDASAAADAQALADFELAVKNDATRWKALHNRGVSLAVANRYDEAIRDFTRVTELQPSHANAWFNRAEIQLELGRYEDAIRDYDRVAALTPNDAGAFTGRAHARFALKQYDAGLRDYDQAVRINRTAETLIDRADAYRSLARWQPAANDYREAMQLDRDHARAYQSAAWFMATCPDPQFRNADLAVRSAEKAAELQGSDDHLFLDTLAAAYANAERWDDAVATVQEAIEVAPESSLAPLEARLALYQAKMPYRQGMK